MSEWEPIETAPRDGSVVLGWPIYGHEGPREMVWISSWDNPKRHRWVVCNLSVSEQKPTHWMPLPEPPSE